MDELSCYYRNIREEPGSLNDNDIMSTYNMAIEKLEEIALDRSLIEAEYPHLAQANLLSSKKQVMKELNCSEKELKAAAQFLGMHSEEYLDTIDLFAIKTYIFYKKARELSYQFDDILPGIYDQDLPYHLDIEKEFRETFEAAKTVVKNANMNPFLNILFKAMLAYTAKESLLNREISDITWEGLNIGWAFKTRYMGED
jgi:hypothetical protein